MSARSRADWETEPLLTFLVTPVFFLQWWVKMYAMKKVCKVLTATEIFLCDKNVSLMFFKLKGMRLEK